MKSLKKIKKEKEGQSQGKKNNAFFIILFKKFWKYFNHFLSSNTLVSRNVHLLLHSDRDG